MRCGPGNSRHSADVLHPRFKTGMIASGRHLGRLPEASTRCRQRSGAGLPFGSRMVIMPPALVTGRRYEIPDRLSNAIHLKIALRGHQAAVRFSKWHLIKPSRFCFRSGRAKMEFFYGSRARSQWHLYIMTVGHWM